MGILDNYMFRPLLAIQGHLGLPATRSQLRGRKRNMPLHNTTATRPFKLDTSHHTLSCL